MVITFLFYFFFLNKKIRKAKALHNYFNWLGFIFVDAFGVLNLKLFQHFYFVYLILFLLFWVVYVAKMLPHTFSPFKNGFCDYSDVQVLLILLLTIIHRNAHLIHFYLAEEENKLKLNKKTITSHVECIW